MKRIKMKDNTTKFVWDGDNCVDKYTELIEQYYYDSEEERMEHKKKWNQMDGMILVRLGNGKWFFNAIGEKSSCICLVRKLL